MKNTKKQYWKGIEQLTNHPEFVKNSEKEFPEYLPITDGKLNNSEGSSRRDFLKLMGFSVAAASLSACEAPIRKAIPYLNKPVEIDPGIPNYYASTYINGGDYCSILVKTREGRPIKIEPNTLTDFSGKGTSAQVQASVLTLYDKERLEGPLLNGQSIEWEELDSQLLTKLERIASEGGQVRLISKTILSPSTKAVIELFKSKYRGTALIQYDPVSSYGMVKANQVSFDKKSLPSYYFDKANVIVNFGADFLGTWINPLKFSADFAKNRKLGNGKSSMSRLYQYESNLSTTGSNADYRTPIRPSSEGLIIATLYNLIASRTGAVKINVPESKANHLESAAEQLWKNRGKSLVISGSNDYHIQMLVNSINYLLGNYGKTIDFSKPLNLRSGDDDKMEQFIAELTAGKIQGVIFLNCNPVYDHYRGKEIKDGLTNVNLKVSTTDRMDETAAEVEYIAPEHHFLESWNDAEPVVGLYSLAQPAISPLFSTRQSQESLLNWARHEVRDYYQFIKAEWKSNIFPTQSKTGVFDEFFDQCLHDGIYEINSAKPEEDIYFQTGLDEVAGAITSTYKAGNGTLELCLYETVAIGDGTHANNPWLQELSDPVTKACWENYLSISQSMAMELGIEMVESETQLVELVVDGNSFTLPALIQPGQAKGTVGLALGYGRTKAGKVANNVGVDAYPLMAALHGLPVKTRFENVEVKATGKAYHIARTQTHQTFMDRDYVIQESILSEYKKDPSAGRHHPRIVVSENLESQVMGEGHHEGTVPPRAISLWKGHAYNNHHWAMAIDMNSCTGCSACIVACQAENNVPVVGKQEVINRREMAWLRIDRYYSSKEGAETNRELEIASDNPEVTFQPMLCQHCNNAPCETVCPVSATTHSTEGLNQMTYNRCVGTRYCANNCPYKVRRFNWFKYHDNTRFPENSSMNNDLGKMVLNPDVTVRSRGVMEKCSFCIQRIQYGKLEAKKEGRRVKDGEVTTACAASCPTNAIVFGDLKDPESKVAGLLKLEDHGERQEIKEPRAYHVLEEINVRPNIWYFTKIRNKEEA